MNLRDAGETDLPAIVAIYNTTIPSRIVTADTEPVSVASRRDWFLAHSPHRRPLWVVEQDDRVVAWLSLQDYYGRPAYHATAEVSVYVAETSRRRGLGRMLLAEIIGKAPGLGIRTLLAFIIARNEPSLRLFEGQGFDRWATLPGI